MKYGDGAFRNVFGYLRLTLPAYEGTTNISAIKSVELSADENVAGIVSIDYSGDEPVATIVSNGSKSLKLNARYKGSGPKGYEAGVVYLIMAPGTYHNVKLTITAFSELPEEQTAATAEPFTVALKKDLVIKRGQYTECKTLPDKAPDVPIGSTTWPNDSDAFDYGLANNETRKAKLSGLSGAEGISNNNITIPVTADKVTYHGPGITYNGNRVTLQQVSNYWSESYPNIIPSQRCISFKINRPGTVRFYPAPASKDGDVLRVPTYYLAVVATRNGVTTAKIVDEVTPQVMADGSVKENRTDTNIYSADWEKYWISLSVKESDISGIESAATVYLFHRNPQVNTLLVHYWPIEWTCEKPAEVVHIGKFLLAGDSTCTEYNASAAPQTGWGQCLAAALGGDPVVKNFAIGGESTKSFIDSGKWDNLCANIVSGDCVLIQFGHNDEKTDDAHHTDPQTTYKENLTKMINDVLDRGGKPVLLTSVCRRGFHSNGDPLDTHGDYPPAMRELALATETPLIDIEAQTRQWLKELGPDGSVPYYIMDKRDPNAMDNSHLTLEGAEAVAGMIATGLKNLGYWE